MMLAWVWCNHWPALLRDVLALGYRASDMFTTLTLADMIAIVVAAPAGSAVRHYIDGGWSRTDHLLANMAEQQAGVATLAQPFQRPGVEDRTQAPKQAGILDADVMEWDAFSEREITRYSGKQKAAKSTARIIKPGVPLQAAV